jgi:uncharacterized protein (DUF983 family)
MQATANNQCPNCGHRFGDLEMLFWGLSKTSKCPGCGVELGVNANRMLLLWVGGIVAILYIEATWSFESIRGWIAIAVLILLLCLVAVRVQRLEIRK